ncbi:G-protein coupled receptor [Biomphalaria glabrata]|nr:G-protein coupled receptor [Biomphalaria glabrata]
MMSVAILRRSGLRKPSNILLFGLVIADSMLQLMTMNFSEILEYFGPDMEYPDLCGWQYSEGVNYFLLVCLILYFFLSSWGQYVSTTIAMVITLERFLAVYMPMTFKKVVTTKTATASVVLSFLIWLPWSAYYLTAMDVYVQHSKVMFFASGGVNVGNLDAYNIFYFFVSDIFSSWVPISIVSIGCTLIAFKIKLTLRDRRKMTSNQDNVKWSMRTTTTLLTTCLVFALTRIIYSCINYFVADLPSATLYLMMEFMNTSLLIDASSNFFVYVATNKKLFNTFIEILYRKSPRNRFP